VSGAASCSVTFRGNGSTGSAQITATTAAPNQAVATFNATVGTTNTSPTQIKFLSANNGAHVAASSTSTYTSPTVGSRVRFQVTNSNGDGVNGQLIQATVDKGYVSAGDTSTPLPGSCNGTNTTDSQSSATITIDGTQTDGVVEFTVCAKSGTTGTINVTAHNLSTSMTDAKTTVTSAGVPSKVETTVTGNSVTAKVTDKDGNEAADGTVVVFTVPAFTGSVAPTCGTTSSGKVSASAAFSTTGGQVLVTVFINDSGNQPAASCNGGAVANGTVAAATASVNVGNGTGTGTGTGAGFTGTAPARGSIGLLVTAGATNAASLVSALGTAGCPVESLAILEGGVWKIYINGAPAVVNAAFPASVGATVAFFVRCQA
jgi:hypothetical protein